MTPNARTCVHGLRYDGSQAAGCVLCQRQQREASARAARRLAWRISLSLLALLVALASIAVLRDRAIGRWQGSLSESSPPGATLPAGTSSSVVSPRIVNLRTKNTSGRSGAYYIPVTHPALLPLLVIFHGTGSSGARALGAFRALADESGFAILGPDSRAAPDGSLTWEVGDHPGDITDDRRHVMACLHEMLEGEHLDLDPAHILAVGHSGGGSSAPYLATNEEPFTAFAVMHGGAFPGGFGARRVRGWFSTGSADSIRPPAMVGAAAEDTRRAGLEVGMRVFNGGHEMGEEERAEIVRWWLGR
jgi:predicted esterase